MRTNSSTLLFILSLSTATGGSQISAYPQPYNIAEAYKIYSLLIPREPSYAFGRDKVLIREEAMEDGSPCLTTSAAKKFADAVVAFNRLGQKKWVLQPRFQLDKPYKLIGPQEIKALPDYPPQSAAASYVEMSTVGFNRDKTQAVLFMGSPCGGLCGVWSFHLFEKIHGKWQEVPGVNCSIFS